MKTELNRCVITESLKQAGLRRLAQVAGAGGKAFSRNGKERQHT